MKRKVRIRKAQLGGVAAIQNAAAEQNTVKGDADIVNDVIASMQNGKSSEVILNELVASGVDQAKAVEILSSIEEYITNQKELEVTQDQDVADDLEAEQQSLEQEAQDEMIRSQQLAELYGYNTNDYDDGLDEEDQSFTENVLYRKGGSPSKRTFMRNAIKHIKAEEGMQMNKNIADFTDTGERAEQLNKFIGTVKNTGEEALMKKDAEAMYDMMMPEARDGMSMSPRQQRRFNRRLNRLVSQNRFPLTDSGFHSPFPSTPLPFYSGLSRFMMPAQGSYQGGPQLANIDVRRTGLFGKPKEYTITFAQEAFTNPQLKRDVYRLEEYNEEQKIKDIEETQNSNSTESEDEEMDCSSGVCRPKSSVTPSSETVVKKDSSKNSSNVIPESVIPSPEITIPEVPVASVPVNTVKHIYSNEYTPGDMYYYNPDKPGFMYRYFGDTLYYDEDYDENNLEWIPIKDKKRVEYLNERLRGADLYTLDKNPGYYYRMRPDGAFAKFKGDLSKHSDSSKQISVIKPGDKNYNFLYNNKVYEGSYQGVKKQEGGFVDPFDRSLQKFIYGGVDASLPETAGKLTNSPYFQEGGLKKAQEGENQTEDNIEEDDTADLESNDYITNYGYNSYAPFVFPGGYAKQRGLPFNPKTGERYYGAYDPSTMSSNLSKIDVTKTRLSGAPKRYTLYFGDYDSTAPLINNTQVAKTPSSNTKDEKFSRAKDIATTIFNPIRRGVTNTLSGYGNEEDSFSRLKDFGTQAAAPIKRLWHNILRRQDGGDLYEAQMAGQSPFLNDPRFANVYTDNPDFLGMSDLDLITPNFGTEVVGATNTGYDWQNVATDDTSKLRTDQDLDPAQYEIDPDQPTRQNLKRNKLKDPWAVNLKVKKTNEQNINDLLKFNARADWALSQLGERGQREKMRKMSDRLKSDALYGSTGITDRGTYDTNSGLFRPDQMGFTGVVKEGGSVSYKEGGETYMSEEQIRKFLEEGGELEFI